MDIILEEDIEAKDEKSSSLNCAYLRTNLAFLLMLAYRQQYSILTELDFAFASGKTRPDLCIMPRRKANWLEDEIVVQDVPITTIEILSPEQSMTGLLDRIYKKHFPAGVKSVWLVIPALEIITVLLPDRNRINVTEGVLTDPVTGLQLNLNDVFGA